MRKISFILLFVLFFSGITSLSAQTLKEKLETLPSVKKIEILDNEAFPEKYLLYFEQPIDHRNPSRGTFLQRVIVGNICCDSSSVIVTEGYGAAYALRPKYRDELSLLLNFNNIVVEHRYFIESCPEGCDWTYLNAENESGDLHNIITELKQIYPHKWIGTGISKGGQTATFYRAFFPDDVDISVPYVAPLCRSDVDGRHEPFIENITGTPEGREKVKEFQIEFLKRREAIQPWFDSLCTANKLEFNIPLNEVYDYCALEFSFSFWQWGTPVSSIPAQNAPDREIFNYMMQYCSPDYFVKECDTTPFFVQAAKELGYYGYDTKPFKEYLVIRNADGYLHKLFLPEGLNVKFDKSLYKKISRFLKNGDSKMLFIYGEYDPWSSVMVSDPHRENIRIFVDPKGSHRARVRTFPEETQKEIMGILKGWLYN